jgi:hypothetical protein
MLLTVTAWILMGALPGALAAVTGAGPRTSVLGLLGVGVIGGVTAGAVVSLAAGPGTVVADLLGPLAALAGGMVLLANLTRPRQTPAAGQAR